MSDGTVEIYCPGMSAKELAAKVLENSFGDKAPSIPIDPFKLMREYGIVYQFREFSGLEGIYLVPEDENDIAVVGINYKRPITRQRFTAAHELCHHIKDRSNEACPIGSGSSIEKFAEQFAAELLMPETIFVTEYKKYLKNGKISLDDALVLSDYFGVSFSSCVRRLAYKYHVLDGDYSNLKRRIEKYKPDNKKISLGIDIENIELLRQAINSYVFFFQLSESQVWYKFKNDFIYNENRLEGLNLEEDEVSEIVADLRMNRQDSVYCKEELCEEIIQVVGHASLYDYIFDTSEKLTIYKILDLNKKLFQYAPYPEEAGKTRTSNNYVLGAKFETVDWRNVANELIKLQTPVEEIINAAPNITVSEYVSGCMKIHHRITQIHPFRDGNGRSSRAFLNWMLRLKSLPPIYFKAQNKEQYFSALEMADKSGDFKELERITIRELFRTIIRMCE